MISLWLTRFVMECFLMHLFQRIWRNDNSFVTQTFNWIGPLAVTDQGERFFVWKEGIDLYLKRINMIETGNNISRLRKEKGLTVRYVQEALGFNNPQAIFKWQRGESLPSLDNLVVLAEVLGTTLDEIVVTEKWERRLSRIRVLLMAGCMILTHAIEVQILSPKPIVVGTQ